MAGKKEKLRVLTATPEETEHRRLLREALGYVLPAPEAEQANAALLSAFGGFGGVFAAPESELLRVPGLGEETARFLGLVTALSRAYLEERAGDLRRIYDTDSAVEVFRPKFLGRKTEAVCLLLLDGRGRLVYNDIVCEGAVSEVPLYIRRLLQLCIEYDVEDVMVAHNHPSGNPAPSRNDLVMTDRLEQALESIDAQLCDHIIITDDDYYSFAKSGMLEVQRQSRQRSGKKRMDEVRERERALLGQDGADLDVGEEQRFGL